MVLIISIVLSSLSIKIDAAQSDGEPSISDGWKIINFDTRINYPGESYKVAVTTMAEAWHHSGNYWSFTWNNVKETFKINDDNMRLLANGTLDSEKITKYLIAEIELPTKIKEYLTKGGNVSDIKIDFSCGDINSIQIFSGNCYYKIENNKLKVAFKPIFKVSDQPIYGKIQDPKMQTLIPQGKPGYSFTTYAIWTKDGKELGVGYSKEAKITGDPTIKDLPDERFIEAPNDILNATGALKPGKDYFYKDKQGNIQKLDPAKMGIGYGTFSGGAVDLL